MVVLQPERFGRITSTVVVSNLDNFAFPKMVSSPIRAQLHHLSCETIPKRPVLQVMINPQFERILSFVVPSVMCVFAVVHPVNGDSQCATHIHRGSFGHDLTSKRFINPSRFQRMPLSSTSTRGCSLADGIDDRTPSRSVDDFIRW